MKKLSEKEKAARLKYRNKIGAMKADVIASINKLNITSYSLEPIIDTVPGDPFETQFTGAYKITINGTLKPGKIK